MLKKFLQSFGSKGDSQLEALYQNGVQAFAAQHYREAAEYALQANALNARRAPIHYLLGSAHFELADYRQAEPAFSACLALKPSYPLYQHALLQMAVAKVRHSKPSLRIAAPTAQHPPAPSKHISVIICSIDPARFASVCANYHALLADVPHDIIGIHDARSLCEGYNRGIRQATGDYLIFSHDDIEIVSPDFAHKLSSYLERFDIIGIAGTTRLTGPAWVHAGWPHFHGQVGSRNSVTGQLVMQCYDLRGSCTPNAQALDGAFFAARREVAHALRFDETHFDGWHLYDVDFTFSAHLAGMRMAICHDLCVIHASGGQWDDAWQHYANVFMAKHGSKLRHGVSTDYGELCSIALASDAEWLLVTQTLNDIAAQA